MSEFCGKKEDAWLRVYCSPSWAAALLKGSVSWLAEGAEAWELHMSGDGEVRGRGDRGAVSRGR